MLAGKTYPFHLVLTNPLYDPIQVRLAVQSQQLPNPASASNEPSGTPAAPRWLHFAVSLPSGSFAIAPFAEAWEYEDDEEMFGIEDEDPGVNASPMKSRGKTKTVGVLEKKANTTIVGGEGAIGREGRGEVKVSSHYSSFISYYGSLIIFSSSSIC